MANKDKTYLALGPGASSFFDPVYGIKLLPGTACSLPGAINPKSNLAARLKAGHVEKITEEELEERGLTLMEKASTEMVTSPEDDDDDEEDEEEGDDADTGGEEDDGSAAGKKKTGKKKTGKKKASK